MRLRPTLFSLVPHTFALVVAVGAAIAAFVDSSFAADTATQAKIERVELGVKNHFKDGSGTPIRSEIDGAPTGEKQQVEVTVEDSDGIPTTASAPLTAGAGGHNSSATVYTKVGRIGSVIQVSLVDGERRIVEQTLRPDAKARPNSTAVALPATAELIVSFGPSPFGLQDAFPN